MKKRVLHLLASNSYSGAENVVCNIINNCGDKYDMFYCSLDGSIRNVLSDKKICFIPLKRLSVLELKKIVKEYNIDLIHAHDFKASFLASFLKIKVISHLHCDYKLLSISFVVAFVYSLIQKKFNKIIVVSQEILNNASFKKKIVDKTVVINNVVNKNMIVCKSMESVPDKYDLIFLGRLIALKQPLFFIDIVNELKIDNPNIRACIVGDGELYDKCQEKIFDLNLDKNIDLLGFKTNPFPYLKNSKVMVMPSCYEGLPLVAIESMSLGTIVVNSGVGGLKTIFKNFPQYICENKSEYISCIKNILKSNKKKYVDDCNGMIKNFVDIDLYKKKFMDIYKEILK